MINQIKRFFEIAREIGLRDALTTTKSYLLFELPDSFFWTPLTRYIYSKYEKIDRSELREQAEITIKTETEFIPFKSIEGVPCREDQGFYRPGDRFVAAVDNAEIKGKKGFVTSSNNNIVSEAIGPPNIQPRRNLLSLNHALKELNFSFNKPAENNIRLASSLIVFAGNAYYHWTVEQLSKIFMLQKYGEKKGEYPDLLVRKDRASFIDESLEIIDYPGNVRYWSGGSKQINTLVVPSYPDQTKEELEWVRDRMISNSKNLDIGKEKILVTRQDAETRRIENFEEVKQELTKLGFETITPGKHTVEEQVNIFKDAEIIVGVHGAGLTNIIYSENAEVIELVGENKNHATFSRISNVLGHNYSRIKCETNNRNLEINIDDIENIVSEKI